MTTQEIKDAVKSLRKYKLFTGFIGRERASRKFLTSLFNTIDTNYGGAGGGPTTFERTLTAAEIRGLAFGPIVVEDFGVPTLVNIHSVAIKSPATTQFDADVTFLLRIASTPIVQLVMAQSPTDNVYTQITRPNGTYYAPNGSKIELTAQAPHTLGEDCKIVITYTATAL